MYVEPTQEAGRALSGIEGPVSMLNLLRFRTIADYSAFPDLDPGEPISGERAYRRYMAHTLPFLTAAGGSVRYLGAGGPVFIGPPDERWDLAMLVDYPDLQAFLGMASNDDYLAGIGHRTAALEDSRLLPTVPIDLE